MKPARPLALLGAVAALTAVVATPAGAAGEIHRATAKKPTVVLVHGSFADASTWNSVTQLLQKDGYTVVATANPLRGPVSDGAYTSSILKSIKGPIVLVGHSYGGAVITNAAARNPQVKSLVYVSAFMPDKGETLGELVTRFPGSELDAALKSVSFQNADGTKGTELYLRPDRFAGIVAPDFPAQDLAVGAASQRPIVASAFTEKATVAAWRTIPSWVLVSRQDKAIPAALQRFEAKRAHSHTVEIDSNHVSPLSHPDAVTDLILDAAGA
ncbi:alpha/beta fold hydrolase [Streptosporangium sp. LJ11]|uniref:alpha/beta fold hydrolase n=1 Tax=Streptosporangium sp. LJ11 TaxID=3436927 RepID=UPI003F7AF622